MGKKILNKVKLIREKQECILQLTNTGDEYSIAFSKNDEGIKQVLVDITQRLKESKQYENKLDLWNDLLLELKKETIEVIELPKHNREFSIHFDLDSSEITAKQTDAMTGQQVSDDLGRSIANILSKTFSEFGVEEVFKIEEALSKKDTTGAFTILEKGMNGGMLRLASKETKTKLLNTLQLLPPSSLESDKRKAFFKIKFVLGNETGLFNLLFEDASEYIDEFGNQSDPKLIRNILLIKANAASKLGKKELAYSLYQEILKDSTDDYGTSAWAHRGLALNLGYDNPDARYHESLAAEAFLLDGNKKQFITSKTGLAENVKKTHPEKAIEYIDEAIDVLNLEDIKEKEWVASLSLNKARIYHNWGKNDEAVKEAERSVTLRGKNVLIGSETRMIASLNAALLLSKKSEDEKNSYNEKYEDMISELEKVILDRDKSSYLLRKRLSHALAHKKYSELEQMEQEVMEYDDAEVIATYWIAIVITKPTMPFIEKLELTEKAWAETSKPKVSTDLKATICNLFASIYLETELDDKALYWYKESLTYNPFFLTSRQNYLALLWKNEKWIEAVEFLEEQRKRFGDLPSILFAYGKSLVEAGESGKALPILRLAQRKNPEAEYISSYIEKALDHWDGTLENVPDIPAIIFPSESVTITSLENCLKDFVRFIGNDKRMSFWKSDPKLKGHKWVSSPEQHGQNLLHTFMKSRFGEKVEAIEEVDTGAGRIDIYLRFENGLKTIIELKMCGGGYSVGYAVSGIEQLTHYLKNKQTHLGFLLVFDGRIRDYGKEIQSTYSYENYTIRSFIADVRPKIK